MSVIYGLKRKINTVDDIKTNFTYRRCVCKEQLIRFLRDEADENWKYDDIVEYNVKDFDFYIVGGWDEYGDIVPAYVGKDLNASLKYYRKNRFDYNGNEIFYIEGCYWGLQTDEYNKDIEYKGK